MPDFDLLSNHVSKLKSLLDDREVGLMSWNMSVGYFWKKIAEMWGVDEGKKEDSEREQEMIIKIPDELKGTLKDFIEGGLYFMTGLATIPGEKLPKEQLRLARILLDTLKKLEE